MMKKKVFVTDDDPGVQDILKIIFENAGYDITIYSSGVDLMSNDTIIPDIYILDKQLSGMDGLEICKKLKNDDRTKNIPIIIVSATPGLALLAKNAGADDFIEKPFKKIDLLDLVAKYAAA